MGRGILIIGLVIFLIGIAFYLLEFLSAFRYLVPAFTLTGLCIIAIGVFLSFGERKKSR